MCLWFGFGWKKGGGGEREGGETDVGFVQSQSYKLRWITQVLVGSLRSSLRGIGEWCWWSARRCRFRNCQDVSTAISSSSIAPGQHELKLRIVFLLFYVCAFPHFVSMYAKCLKILRVSNLCLDELVRVCFP